MIPFAVPIHMGANQRMVLSVTDSTPSGANSDFAACGTVASNVTTVSVASGGASPFTYAWTQVGTPATNGPFTPSNASGAATNWSDTRCDTDAVNSETWRCTVTDNNGRTATIDVTVTLTWTNLS